MEIEEALRIVREAGYRVSKPPAKQKSRSALNAIGKPFGANFDSKYKVKMSLTSITRLRHSTGKLSEHMTAA